MQFVKHTARHAHHHCFHLRCLQICTHMLVAKDFSPPCLEDGWDSPPDAQSSVKPGAEEIAPCAWLILLWHLCCCLEKNHLGHLLLGSERVSEEMVLSPAF